MFNGDVNIINSVLLASSPLPFTFLTSGIKGIEGFSYNYGESYVFDFETEVY
jgi:hypothetical protein